MFAFNNCIHSDKNLYKHIQHVHVILHDAAIHLPK